MIQIRKWTGLKIKDFQVLSSEENNSSIIVLHEKETSLFVEIYNIPSFERTYSLPVSSSTFLVQPQNYLVK